MPILSKHHNPVPYTTATTPEFDTLSLHHALPISSPPIADFSLPISRARQIPITLASFAIGSPVEKIGRASCRERGKNVESDGRLKFPERRRKDPGRPP